MVMVHLPHVPGAKGSMVPVDPGHLDRIIHLVSSAFPGDAYGHLGGAVAAGLGLPGPACQSACPGQDPEGHDTFDWKAFSNQMADAGHPGFHPSLALEMDVHREIVQRVMVGGGKGWIWSFLDVLERQEQLRVQLATAGLAARGLAPSPRHQVSGGVMGSITWSLAWCDQDPGEPRAHAWLRLAFPGGSGNGQAFGWGEQWPGYGIRVIGEGVLRWLSGGWPARCLSVHGPADVGMPHDPRGFLGGDAQAQEPMLFSLGDQGLCVVSGDKVFSPCAETVLAIESLVALGDAVARGLEGQVCPGPPVQAVRDWWEQRRTDGLRPCMEHDWMHEGNRPPGCVDAQADWMADRMCVEPGAYRRAAWWAAALDVILADGVPGAPGYVVQPADGVLALVLGFLPDPDVVDRLVARALEGTVPPFGDPSGQVSEASWRQDALDRLNLDLWPCAYYVTWDQRRAESAVGLLERSRLHRQDLEDTLSVVARAALESVGG